MVLNLFNILIYEFNGFFKFFFVTRPLIARKKMKFTQIYRTFKYSLKPERIRPRWFIIVAEKIIRK